MCNTQYLLHIDCSVILKCTTSQFNFVEEAIKCIDPCDDVLVVGIPPENTKHIIKDVNERFFNLRRFKKKPNRNHLSLKAFILDIEKCKTSLMSNLHKYAHSFTSPFRQHHTENIFDKCLHEHNVDILYLNKTFSKPTRVKIEQL